MDDIRTNCKHPMVKTLARAAFVAPDLAAKVWGQTASTAEIMGSPVILDPKMKSEDGVHFRLPDGGCNRVFI